MNTTRSILLALATGLFSLCACSGSDSYLTAEAPLPTSAPHYAPYAAEAVEAAGPAELEPDGTAPDRLAVERYAPIREQAFLSPLDAPLSTFSVDVDTASYSNVRRFVTRGALPPVDAVRVEELINYFDYEPVSLQDGHPIGVDAEVARSPFSPSRRLVRIRVSARDPEAGARPARNLVFLIDVSGSMEDDNKLPLLKRAFEMLVDDMDARDSVSIVAYAGASGVVLPPTRGDQRSEILSALDRLSAGGSTHGSAGIELAYQLAEAQRAPGAVNRVLLATDGDFNVGVTGRGDLIRLIERERDRGVFLTVLGFGMYNLNDANMEALADHGNGNYAYIDTLAEAQKVLVRGAAATLRTVAKDAKVQVEFNPARVERYRLIGYDNRRLEAQEFNDDRRDAGDMGDGHTVTALYELVMRGDGPAAADVDALRYQSARKPSVDSRSDELMRVKVRYKAPAGAQSRLLTLDVRDRDQAFEAASDDFRFAAAVAGFGLWLRRSPHVGQLAPDEIAAIARAAGGVDPFGDRRAFVALVERASSLPRAR